MSTVFSPKKGDQWVKKNYKIKGAWTIEEEEGVYHFSVDDKFSTSSGPDLKLYFTSVKMEEIGNNDPIDVEGEYIAELDSNKGAQKYILPKDPSNFNTIMIHCKKYSVVWGGIDLTKV